MKRKQPLYEQVSKKIVQAIQAGQFREILPTEHELSTLYAVSRATIRSALQKLNADNIIQTLHGKGSYITNQMHDVPLRIDKMKGFYQLLSDTCDNVSLKELGVETVNSFKCDYALPAEFYTGPVLIIKRLLLCNNQPKIYIEEHIASHYLQDSNFNNLPNSIYDLVYELTKQRIKYTVSRFHPVLPSAEGAKIFEIGRRSPIFMATEQHYNMLNCYMIFSKVYLNSSKDMQIGLIRTK